VGEKTADIRAIGCVKTKPRVRPLLLISREGFTLADKTEVQKQGQRTAAYRPPARGVAQETSVGFVCRSEDTHSAPYSKSPAVILCSPVTLSHPGPPKCQFSGAFYLNMYVTCSGALQVSFLPSFCTERNQWLFPEQQLRLRGASGGQLVQPPCSSRATWSWSLRSPA